MNLLAPPAPRRVAVKKEILKKECVVDQKKYALHSVNPESMFEPRIRKPLPEKETLRLDQNWWVRCVSGEMIPQQSCEKLFLKFNAVAMNKMHPCWGCSLGKAYRELRGKGFFEHRPSALFRPDNLK